MDADKRRSEGFLLSYFRSVFIRVNPRPKTTAGFVGLRQSLETTHGRFIKSQVLV